MKYVLISLLTTMLTSLAGYSQQKPVKILSITNGQQLLVEVEQHGRAVRLACLQAPRFRQEPWAEFAQSVIESHVKRGDQAFFELRSTESHPATQLTNAILSAMIFSTRPVPGFRPIIVPTFPIIIFCFFSRIASLLCWYVAGGVFA